MSPTKKGKPDRRKQAYDHVLRSLWSAYHVLIEACHEIEDVDLGATRNTHDLNLILNWVRETSAEIYKLYPELAPPAQEPSPRRWPTDPQTPASTRDLTREDGLYSLRRHLELAQLILAESIPFAGQLQIPTGDLNDQLAKVNVVHDAVVQELWKDLPDERRRAWIRHSGMPEGVSEPAQPDRHAAVGRLNEKLESAAKVLDECAGLVVDLELEPEAHLRSVGRALATIFEIQHQIYEQRPDLIPQYLKGPFELRKLEEKDREE